MVSRGMLSMCTANTAPKGSCVQLPHQARPRDRLERSSSEISPLALRLALSVSEHHRREAKRCQDSALDERAP